MRTEQPDILHCDICNDNVEEFADTIVITFEEEYGRISLLQGLDDICVKCYRSLRSTIKAHIKTLKGQE